MRVLVLGAGVIGVTSAYYLARAGHEVTVIEREAEAARETSHANAGQLSFGYASPWAAPGIPLKAAQWLFERHAPLSLRPDGTLFQLEWMLRLLRNCTPARYAENKERLLRLAAYSRISLHALVEETGVAYEGRRKGTLQLFRTAQQMRDAQRDVLALEAAGIAHALIPAHELATREPGLARARPSLAGGLYLPDDETGDCRLFTQALARYLEARGVQFRYGETIHAIQHAGGHLRGVQTSSGLLQADACVVALGAYSTLMLREILPLPVYPMKGYSITLQIADPALAPQSTLLDETYKVAITRFDARIRVGGMAEMMGYDTSLDPRRRHTLEMVIHDLFPDSTVAADPHFWTGLRPKTPDSTPIIGRTPIENLFLNTGHGTLGWTLACGSGQLLADIMTGRDTAIRADDLGLQRYRHAVVNRPRPPSNRRPTESGS